jgi:uncharacterized protein involved in type VI secretion and phage assembly
MPEPTQANRRLAIETPLGDDVLLVRRCVVREQINRPFQIDVNLASKKNDINFDEIVGKNVTVRVEISKGQTRFFNGYVARFLQTKSERNYSAYQATVVPWLWFLTRSADCRIFQETMEEPPDAMTVPGILKKVFKDHGFEEHFRDDGLSGSFPKREFCVQYRETAFNFVSRLMEHEGIAYYFEHSNGAHKLVLANAATSHDALPEFETITYDPHVQDGENREAITDWIAEKEVQAGNYLLNDFNFENPRQGLQHGLVATASVSRAPALSELEIYDYPGDYPVLGAGEATAQLRIEELQARRESVGKPRDLGIPLRARQRDECGGVEVEVRRDCPERGVVRLAVLQFRDGIRREAGERRELRVVDPKPSLGLADDVGEIVFEWQAAHATKLGNDAGFANAEDRGNCALLRQGFGGQGFRIADWQAGRFFRGGARCPNAL